MLTLTKYGNFGKTRTASVSYVGIFSGGLLNTVIDLIFKMHNLSRSDSCLFRIKLIL